MAPFKLNGSLKVKVMNLEKSLVEMKGVGRDEREIREGGEDSSQNTLYPPPIFKK